LCFFAFVRMLMSECCHLFSLLHCTY